MLATDLADLVLSRACGGCGRLGPVLCGGCWDAFVDVHEHSVTVRGLPPITVATHYRDLPKDALIAHKEHGVLAYGMALGGWLAVAVSHAVAGPVRLVPIPPHADAIARRGVDALDRIVSRAIAELRAGGREVDRWDALHRIVDRGRHVGRSSRERRIAIEGSMGVRSRASIGSSSAALVVVDDVVTTGATVHEAVRVLREAGRTIGAIAAVAGTPRSRQSGETGLHALHDGVDP